MTEAIGGLLRKARQGKDLSLEQAAQGTFIRQHYLEAMEAGRFDRLPSRAQARGLLRAYASYLELDPEPFLASLHGENGDVSAALATAPEAVSVEGVGETEPEPVAANMAEIGEALREQRELLGLSLEDVARHTHLRLHYLKALEAGRLEGLPSPVQGRGMLHNYAVFLGMNPDPLLLKFADELQARLAEKQATQPKPRRTRRAPLLPAPARRLLSTDILLGGMLLLSLAGFIIWGAIRVNDLRSQVPPSPTLGSIAEALISPQQVAGSPSPSASIGPTENAPLETGVPVAAVEGQATEAGLPGATEGGAATEAIGTGGESQPGQTGTAEGGTPVGNSSGNVQVYITVLQRTWVRVTVDGEVELEGRVIPGSAYAFAGDEQVEILTGNGAGLQVFFQQRDLGPMGIFGEVVDRIYTAEGPLVPTPTVTPTPTITPTPSPTPEATLAPTPSP